MSCFVRGNGDVIGDGDNRSRYHVYLHDVHKPVPLNPYRFEQSESTKWRFLSDHVARYSRYGIPFFLSTLLLFSWR